METDDVPIGPDVPDWIIADYYANGPQPYLLRLMRTFTEINRRRTMDEEDHSDLSTRSWNES